jgi:hypothetical protein
MKSFTHMTLEKFYSILDKLNDFEKIPFILEAELKGFHYENDYHPEKIIFRFFRDSNDPAKIAQAMTKCFGNQIICRQISYHYGRTFTILDVLDMELLDAMNSNDQILVDRIRLISSALRM